MNLMTNLRFNCKDGWLVSVVGLSKVCIYKEYILIQCLSVKRLNVQRIIFSASMLSLFDMKVIIHKV